MLFCFESALNNPGDTANAEQVAAPVPIKVRRVFFMGWGLTHHILALRTIINKRNLLVSFRYQMKPETPPGPVLPRRCSLVAQTVQSLCEGIQTGFWKGFLPGERELSERLQVSRRTLRAALEELQRMGWLSVSPRKRRQIIAKGITDHASSEEKVIAVLCSDSFTDSSTPMTFVMDVLRDKLTKAGCVVEFHSNRACFSSRPAKALAKLVNDHSSVAWLLLGSREPMQRWFLRHRLPCLVVGSCAPGIVLPSVDVDYRAACHHAGGVLWRAGHRRIAFVQPSDAQGGDVDGEEGLCESLQGMPEAQLQVLRHDGTSAHLCSLLDETMRSTKPPSAYLVARPMHVLTVMMHLMQHGKRIPQDVTVISRDDAYYLESANPVVARYATNPAGLARRVAMCARQLAETGALPANAVRLVPKFVPGETL